MQTLVVHIRENFTKVFVGRMIEWEHSMVLFTFGLALMIQPQLFESSTSYAAFRAVRPSADFWGLAAMTVATIRFLVLLINGTIRRSPHLRALFAAVSAGIWVLAAVGGLVADKLSQATGLYIAFVGWEFVIFLLCVHYAKLEDVGAADRVRQRHP